MAPVDADPVGIDRERIGQNMPDERIEAPVVHIREKLRRPDFPLRAFRPFDPDLPRFPGARPQRVAESREADRELLVVPRHGNRLRQRHPLVISQGRQLDGEPAPVRVRDRDLEERLGPVVHLTPFHADPGFVHVEVEDLVGQPRGHEEARRAAHRDGAAFDREHGRQREACLLARDQKVPRHLEDGAEVVRRRVIEPVGPGGQAPDLDERFAPRIVRDLSARDFLRPHHGGRVVSSVPARPQRVAGRPELVAGGGPGARDSESQPSRDRLPDAARGRQVGRKARTGGLLEGHDAPRALARARRAVEIRAGDQEPPRARREQESRRIDEARLDGNESEPEGA